MRGTLAGSCRVPVPENISNFAEWLEVRRLKLLKCCGTVRPKAISFLFCRTPTRASFLEAMATQAVPAPYVSPFEQPVNPWLIAVVVSLAAFMEVLDTSIANVALPHIAGDLGASSDESTWVLTSYLVSNAIILPVSGWFVGKLGRKRFFMICIIIFTLSSLLCGVAWSLGFLLIARVLQGAGGGGLQPMAQAILADTFPPEKRGLAFSLYGVTAIVAPSIGPTLGGWITDNYSWRWIFYINLPVGLIALFLVYKLIETPPISAAMWEKRCAWTTSASVYWQLALALCRFFSTRARKTTGLAQTLSWGSRRSLSCAW
jgi:multidrug resistance protein